MAQQIAILNTKAKSKHVDVGQHRATGGEHTDFSSSGTRRQRLRDSDASHGMRQYGGHHVPGTDRVIMLSSFSWPLYCKVFAFST